MGCINGGSPGSVLSAYVFCSLCWLIVGRFVPVELSDSHTTQRRTKGGSIYQAMCVSYEDSIDRKWEVTFAALFEIKDSGLSVVMWCVVRHKCEIEDLGWIWEL